MHQTLRANLYQQAFGNSRVTHGASTRFLYKYYIKFDAQNFTSSSLPNINIPYPNTSGASLIIHSISIFNREAKSIVSISDTYTTVSLHSHSNPINLFCSTTPKADRPWRQRMAESSRIRSTLGDDVSQAYTARRARHASSRRSSLSQDESTYETTRVPSYSALVQQQPYSVSVTFLWLSFGGDGGGEIARQMWCISVVVHHI